MRTLRSWIAQGVVPGAETAGRNARYSPAALTRARAAKAMRELYGMSLPAIRQDLLTADEAKIEAYAALAGSVPEAAGGTGAPGTAISAPSPSPPAGASAAVYLRNLRSAGVFRAEPPKAVARPAASGARRMAFAPSPEAAPLPGSRLSRLAEALEQIAGQRPSRRKAKGDVRLHIPITPDLTSAIALLGLAAIPASAMPVAPLSDAPTSITLVAMGCGPGWTRGPYGHCHPMGYGVAVVPGPYYG